MRKPFFVSLLEAAGWYVMAAAAGALAILQHGAPPEPFIDAVVLVHRAASLVALLSIVLDFAVIPED